MRNYVTSLWLLFWGVLLSGISDLLPESVSGLIQLVGGVLGIVAIVQLSSRNWRLEKAKYYMIASFVALVVMLLSGVIFADWLVTAVIIIGTIVILVLSILATYLELHGLADMAEESGNSEHARRLRQFFTIYIIVAVLSLLSAVPSLAVAVAIVSAALTIYQIYLYYQSIKTEKAYAQTIE